MTILEAMAVGVPVVATRVGEVPHIVDDDINGFVRRLDDPVEAFVQPFVSLLSPARRQLMGEAARQKIIDSFQQQTMVQQYKDAIAGIL